MFDYSLGLKDVAQKIDMAIWDCISNGECTPDLGGAMNTAEAATAVRNRLVESFHSRASNG
jgi:isocitrate/isopropylmalate dehydrogenase